MKYSHSEIPQLNCVFSPEKLKMPDVDFYPAFAWSWTSPVEKNEIMRQLDYMFENNIKTVYILPQPKDFRPKTSPTNLEPDYLTKEYFEIYRFAMEYAAKLGMQLWLYDEGGWPSGSANHRVVAQCPRLRNAHLEKRTAASPYVAGENAVAAFCGGNRISEGFASESKITEYFYTCSPWEPELPNLCMEESTSVFINLTHEQYKKYMSDMFGRQMKVAFTDEPAISHVGWFEGIEKCFEKKYGYSLIDYLPFLLDFDDAPEDALRARQDYRDLLGERFFQSYFMPIRDWYRKNGLLSAGHLGGEDETKNCIKHGFISVLRQLRGLDIPGIDTIWRQIFPGKDNHFFPRFASSAANQIGSPYAVSESFSIYSHGITFEQMRYVMNYQMVRGINLINIMLLNYENDGVRRVKGGPSFNPLMPHWKHLSRFNMYTARMSYLMCIGKPVIDCALYMPMNDFWAGGDGMEPAFESFDSTGHELEKHHIPFDCIDDDFLETCVVNGGSLSTGSACYTAVVIPTCKRMPQKSVHVLENFKKNGGTVIYSHEIDSLSPICHINNEKIMVHKRISDSCALYLVTNEDTKSHTFDIEFGEKGNIYILNASDGNIYRADGTENVTLASGESKVYMITEGDIASSRPSKKGEMLAVIGNFKMRPIYRFLMGTTHFEAEYPDTPFTDCTPGNWCDRLGQSFSGVVQYRMHFDLDEIPENGVIIDMGSVKHSCEVRLNGHNLGICCAAPYVFTAGKAVLHHHNEIVAEVANTPGNEFRESRIYETVPANIIGPYRRIVAQFEGDTMESGLTTHVTVYKALT
ncbi:MAG: hypothetical protein E7588_08610 [Ruminococcaceae bacterium]|nr:hypothetical protein [Oscillospiraceae bacterium]